jgi:regulatory protein
MIIFKLSQKGVKEAFIYQALSTINEYALLTEVVQSKLNQMKSKTKKQAFQSIRVLLISKGFHREVIDAVLSSPDTHYVGDESKLLEKAYDKIYKTYAHKYQGYELEQKIKEKLYQKGFAYDVIKNYIEEKKLQSW